MEGDKGYGKRFPVKYIYSDNLKSKAVIAGAYAFLTIQVEDTTIMDFIRYACAYFLTTQQYFEWRHSIQRI